MLWTAVAHLWLCSQIGQPIAHPWITSAQVSLTPGVALADVGSTITEIIEGELAALPAFIAQLVRGAFPVW
jgi:S-adenosylmethionine synthetase